MKLRNVSLVGALVAGAFLAGTVAKAEDAAMPGVVTPEQAAANLAAAKAAPDVALTGDAVKGEVIYKQYCLLCHGDTGDGDGVGAAALNPKPRKFSDKAIMSAIPNKEMLTVIKEGGTYIGKSMFMVSWKTILSEDQIEDVATYVRTLAK